MPTQDPLPRTKPLSYRSTGRLFSDHYAKQWTATRDWMQTELDRIAKVRDKERRLDAGWTDRRRLELAAATGVSLFEAPPASEHMCRLELSGAERPRLVGAPAYGYAIRFANGLESTGAILLPDGGRSAQTEAVVFLILPEVDIAGAAGGREADADEETLKSWEVVNEYLAQGIGVVLPLLSAERFTFREDQKRRAYAYPDHELLQFFSFILGGSLAGLEAFEIAAAARSLPRFIKSATHRPLTGLHVGGRRLLAGTVAAALYPELFDLLVIGTDPRSLDHQEEDDRSNTIYGFHKQFDALTLFQTAAETDLLFVDESATWSGGAARARLWLSDRRVCRCRPNEVAARAAELLPERPRSVLPAHEGTGTGNEDHGSRPAIEAETIEAASIDAEDSPVTGRALYRRAVRSKVTYLEDRHRSARRALEERRADTTWSWPAYGEKVHEDVQAVMGPALPRSDDLNVRTLKVEESGPLDRYEVLIESVPGIDTAGHLLVPTQGEGPFAAVICQHGLMGRPEDLLDENGNWVYYRIARVMAEKGYVVFVPFMNWGWGGTPARDVLAKHAYALGVTPNRFEVAQIHGIFDFLQERPEVDPERIAFYGLSYGGHASLWLGACEPRLAAVVTAGHFNLWNKKLTSLEPVPGRGSPTSYITVNEGMDMFTFDILNRFDHAELATVNAPRPYMVENGLQDSVSPRPWVEAEFAAVRSVYEKIGAQEKVQLVHFDGPHRIWGEESLAFLHRHLRGR